MKKALKKSLVCILALVCAAGSLLADCSKSDEQGAALLNIDGTAIYKEEFLYYAEQIALEVRDELIGKAQTTKENFSWEDKVGEKTGYQWLQERTVTELVSWKTVQMESKKLNLVTDVDYRAIMKAREKENKERREKKENGEVLYGVVEYSAEEYMDYFNSNLQSQYMETLAKEGTLQLSEEEIKAVYEQQKDYFGNESYDKVRNSARIVALTEKYQEYLEKLVQQAEVEIVDEPAAEQALREVLGE